MATKREALYISCDKTVMRKVREYGKHHALPVSRVLSRMIAAVPWDDDNAVQYVLSVPKSLHSDTDKLKKAMIAAVEAIIEQYELDHQ